MLFVFLFCFHIYYIFYCHVFKGLNFLYTFFFLHLFSFYIFSLSLFFLYRVFFLCICSLDTSIFIFSHCLFFLNIFFHNFVYMIFWSISFFFMYFDVFFILFIYILFSSFKVWIRNEQNQLEPWRALNGFGQVRGS